MGVNDAINLKLIFCRSHSPRSKPLQGEDCLPLDCTAAREIQPEAIMMRQLGHQGLVGAFAEVYYMMRLRCTRAAGRKGRDMNCSHNVSQRFTSTRTLQICTIKILILILTPFCLLEVRGYTTAHLPQDEPAYTSKLMSVAMVSESWLRRRILPEPTAISFLAASMANTSLAYTYYRLNARDKHQQVIIAAAFVAGIMVALGLEIREMAAVLSMGAWSLFTGLLLSDLFHFFCVRQPRQPRQIEDGMFGEVALDEKLAVFGVSDHPRLAAPCQC
ncbi:hypothetical protein Q7P37_003937 [Cladosporium fusiforme]